MLEITNTHESEWLKTLFSKKSLENSFRKVGVYLFRPDLFGSPCKIVHVLSCVFAAKNVTLLCTIHVYCMFWQRIKIFLSLDDVAKKDAYDSAEKFYLSSALVLSSEQQIWAERIICACFSARKSKEVLNDPNMFDVFKIST